jgi:hypothetical protein
MSTRTLTDYLASLPTATSNGSEQVPAVKGGDLVNLASQLITEPRSTTTVVAGDAGKLFFSGGQMWRYVDGTEGWDLPVGTPWPVKGYKEWVGQVILDTVPATTVISADFTMTLARTSQGIYDSVQSNFIDTQIVIITEQLNGDQADLGGFGSKLVASVASQKIRFVTTSVADGLDDNLFTNHYVTIRQYPPLP